MARGSKYTDDFAAGILALCDLSPSITEVLKARNIPRSTHTDWEARALRDTNFAQLRQAKRKQLEKEWKRFALSSLRSAFQKSQELIETCSQPEHLEYLNAHIKTVGEIAINIEVLNGLETDAGPSQIEDAGKARA